MMFECPVPDRECIGTKVQIEPGGGQNWRKAHGSGKEVIACIRKYFAKNGYEPMPDAWKNSIKRREMINKETGYVLIISKKPGVPLRRGKEGTRYIRRTFPHPSLKCF